MQPLVRRLLIAAAALVALPLTLGAQPAPVGTLLVAHGGGPEWNAQVKEVAALARTGGLLEVSFLMGPGAPTHRFQDAVRRLVEQGAREIVVVPLLVSSHSGHYEQIRYLAGQTDSLDEQMRHHLHMAGIERASVPVPISVTRAIDDAAEITAVLADRALALATAPREQALFLIGHGPNSAEDHAVWMRNLRPVAERVKQATGFRDVKIGLVRDDAPAEVRAEAVRAIRETIELQSLATGKPVVVVPVLIATGQVSREKLPRDLAGLPIVYRGEALLPHPGMARWVEASVQQRRPAAAPPAAAPAAHTQRH
mgnify:CR=1 FL=1